MQTFELTAPKKRKTRTHEINYGTGNDKATTSIGKRTVEEAVIPPPY